MSTLYTLVAVLVSIADGEPAGVHVTEGLAMIQCDAGMKAMVAANRPGHRVYAMCIPMPVTESKPKKIEPVKSTIGELKT